jgi:hypothetical protein
MLADFSLAESDPATLPSSDAVAALLDGKPGAIWGVAFSTVLRAGLIGAGMYAAGFRERQTILRGSIAGALAIELFVFGWVMHKRRQSA